MCHRPMRMDVGTSSPLSIASLANTVAVHEKARGALVHARGAELHIGALCALRCKRAKAATRALVRAVHARVVLCRVGVGWAGSNARVR